MQIELSIEEIKELLYWHSETPDTGLYEETEDLAKKLRDLLPDEEK